jgi:sulfite reductase (NADPH) flavoprotein alpha-component
MTVPALPSPALTGSQWETLQALATTLDQGQLLWASGFLAGVGHTARGAAEASVAGIARPDPPVAAPLRAASRTLTILYGSETGNSAALAQGMAGQARSLGLAATAVDMGDYRTRGLKDEQDLVVVTSTYGDGDPPQPAAAFFDMIEGRKAPRLEGVRFAVLALGDSTYERFCEAGKRIDRRLEALGAARLAARLDCDVDYEDAAAQWVEKVLGALAQDGAGRGGDAAGAAPARPGAPAGRPAHDRRNPFAARIIDNIVLTGRGSTKETRHIELALDGSGLHHEPGDALGIIPENDGAAVERLTEALGIDPAHRVEAPGEAMPAG